MKLLPLCFLLIFAGCGSSSTTPEQPASVVGTYTLQSINGTRLPYVTESDSVTSGSLTLAVDGTFVESRRLHFGGADHDESEPGTYIADGTVVTLHGSYGDTLTSGQGDGHTLAFVEAGLIFSYAR